MEVLGARARRFTQSRREIPTGYETSLFARASSPSQESPQAARYAGEVPAPL